MLKPTELHFLKMIKNEQPIEMSVMSIYAECSTNYVNRIMKVLEDKKLVVKTTIYFFLSDEGRKCLKQSEVLR